VISSRDAVSTGYFCSELAAERGKEG